MNRIVSSPTDVGFQSEDGVEKEEESSRSLSGVIEGEKFREFIAKLAGEFDPSFRAGQLNTLIGKMSRLKKGESISLVCPVGFRGEKTALQIHALGIRGMLMLRMEGGRAPMDLVDETFMFYRRPQLDAAEFRECRIATEEYDDLLDLRFLELRAPLGLRWTVEDLQWEQLERHFGVFLLDQPIATMVVRSLRDGGVRLRQIAVSHEHRGQGYGRMVMKETETLLLSEGVTSLELHARENVVGFYEKIGFQQVGSIFFEIGIPHVLMKKGLGES